MKRLKLANDDFALVDDSDFEILSKFNWYVAVSQGGKKYAVATIRMHRFLLNPPKNLGVDHKNGNTLDNTRGNLRIATKSQNAANQKLRKDNKLGFKGVTKWKNKYRARIQVNNKQITLGYFDNPEDASNAYNIAASKYFGEFYNKG